MCFLRGLNCVIKVLIQQMLPSGCFCLQITGKKARKNKVKEKAGNPTIYDVFVFYCYYYCYYFPCYNFVHIGLIPATCDAWRTNQRMQILFLCLPVCISTINFEYYLFKKLKTKKALQMFARRKEIVKMCLG